MCGPITGFVRPHYLGNERKELSGMKWFWRAEHGVGERAFTDIRVS